MAGIALVLDLLKKKPSFTGQTLHSYGLFTASLAASTAAASVAAGNPFASRFLFGIAPKVAHADAGAVITKDYISSLRTAYENIFQHDSPEYNTKEYYIDVKPIFSAFHWRTFAVTSLRSFLLFYLPLLEPRANMEDDDDFLQETPEEHPVDLIVPLRKSVKQIGRETTITTTRRILERLTVHYISQRMAWKLLKDVPTSAVRKAGRGMPTLVYFVSVSRTTFRGQILGVLASWLVQVGIDCYLYFSHVFNSEEETDSVHKAEHAQLLQKKVYGATIRCGSSLVFASIGAGLGAIIIRPSTGQWIGCTIGDLAGPFIVSACFKKFFQAEL